MGFAMLVTVMQAVQVWVMMNVADEMGAAVRKPHLPVHHPDNPSWSSAGTGYSEEQEALDAQ